jgi:threonine 3-dehydrogenase
LQVRTPTSCLAAVFHGPNRRLELSQFDVPELESGEVLVRIRCCTICGSDLHTFSGLRTEPTPTILGHEAVGSVEHIGSAGCTDANGKPLRMGDRVTWSVAVSCFKCARCLSGLPQKCVNLSKYGHELAIGRQALSGGLAEYILLRAGSTIYTVDEALQDSVVCPSNCATATIAACYRMAGNVSSKRVLILGAGMLGLTAAAFASAQNASDIVVVDANPSRLARARLFGATATALWDDDSRLLKEQLPNTCEQLDVVIELSGASEAVAFASEICGIGGKLILAGTVMPTQPVALHPETIVRRCLSIHGVHNYAPQDLRTAIEFLGRSRDRYPFDKLVEKSFRLSDINDAMQFAMQERPVRIAIFP